MTTPVRTAAEMRDAAIAVVERCTNLLSTRRLELSLAIRSIPIAPGPTVEEAVLVYRETVVAMGGVTGAHAAALRAVLDLCGGETRERWESWEEAARAASDEWERHESTAPEDYDSEWLAVARAVLAKAPPKEG